MWFDEIIDDCKQALQVISSNKVVFVPILISALFNVLFIILFVVGIIFFVVANMRGIEAVFNGNLPSVGMVVFTLVGMVIGYLLVTSVKAMMEVGSINMYKAAIDGIKPKAQHFFEGIKKCFFRVFGITVFIHIMIILLFLPIAAILLLYSLTIGILSAGWGITLIFILVGVYFGAWIIAIVEDNIGGFKAVGRSIRLGRKYFWGLFVLSLSGIMISKYVATAFGGLVSLIAGWFLAAAVLAYLKIVIFLIYKRKKAELVR